MDEHARHHRPRPLPGPGPASRPAPPSSPRCAPRAGSSPRSARTSTPSATARAARPPSSRGCPCSGGSRSARWPRPPATRSATAGSRSTREEMAKRYFDWVDNLHDWCISRQLWWGHRIPVWYGPNGEVVCVGPDERAAERRGLDARTPTSWTPGSPPACGRSPRSAGPSRPQTWRSSIRTRVLVTGYDILFFWVARMMMFGLYAMDGTPPFHTIALHGMVRDQFGKKMSKSFGNAVNPLDWMDKYGSDAVRFTLARGANPGVDVPIGEDWVQASRNFANKIWNATRFALMNGATVEGELPARRAAVGDRPLDPVPAERGRRRGRRVLRGLPVREALATRSTTSRGTRSSTGTSSCPRRRFVAGGERGRGLRGASSARSSTSRCGCCTRSSRSSPRRCGPRSPAASRSSSPTGRSGQRLPRRRPPSAEIEDLQQVVTEVRRFRADQGLQPGQRVPARLDAGRHRAGRRTRPPSAQLLRLQPEGEGFTRHRTLPVAGRDTVALDLSGDDRRRGRAQAAREGPARRPRRRRRRPRPSSATRRSWRRRPTRSWTRSAGPARRPPRPTCAGIDAGPARSPAELAADPRLDQRGPVPQLRRLRRRDKRRPSCVPERTASDGEAHPADAETDGADLGGIRPAAAPARPGRAAPGRRRARTPAGETRRCARSRRDWRTRWGETKLEPSVDRIAALMDVLGEPQRAYPLDPHHRHERQDLHRPHDRGAARAPSTCAPGRLHQPARASRSPSASAWTARPIAAERFVETYDDIKPYVEMVDAAAGVPAVLLRGAHRHGVRRLRRRARGRGRRRGRHGRHLGRDERHRRRRSPSSRPSTWTTPTGSATRPPRSPRRRPGSSSRAPPSSWPSSRSTPPQVLLRKAVEVDATVAREGLEFGVVAREVAVGGQLLDAARPGRRVRRDLPAAARRAPGAQRGRRARRRRGVLRRGRRRPGRRHRPRGVRRRRLAGPPGGRAARARRWSSTPRTTRRAPPRRRGGAGGVRRSRRLVGVVGRAATRTPRACSEAFEPVFAEVVVTRSNSPPRDGRRRARRDRRRGVRRGPRAGRSRGSTTRWRPRSAAPRRAASRGRRRPRHRLDHPGRRRASTPAGTVGAACARPAGPSPLPSSRWRPSWSSSRAWWRRACQRCRRVRRCLFGGLAIACLLAAGMLGRPWGYAFGWLVQAAVIVTGFWVPVMFFLGALFAVLWFVALRQGARIERERRSTPPGPELNGDSARHLSSR